MTLAEFGTRQFPARLSSLQGDLNYGLVQNSAQEFSVIVEWSYELRIVESAIQVIGCMTDDAYLGFKEIRSVRKY